jgi:GTP cyclohydrolase I
MSMSTIQPLNEHRTTISIVKGDVDIDRSRAQAAIRDLFQALRVDLSAPDLVDTPRRLQRCTRNY